MYKTIYSIALSPPIKYSHAQINIHKQYLHQAPELCVWQLKNVVRQWTWVHMWGQGRSQANVILISHYHSEENGRLRYPVDKTV